MLWLKKIIARWVEQANDSDYDTWDRIERDRSDAIGPRPDLTPTMNFKVYNAHGGKVVEFRQYDHKNDIAVNKLYIIGEDADFGDSIKHIAMMHLLSTTTN